jgi:hypothetical protein
MPLEDLTGTGKFIDDLNEAWPLGSDLPDAGDDHLRGIKQVLVNTFPNVSGPITLSDAQINAGSVPAGSILPFYQASAPAGWSRVTGFSDTFAMRIVGSAVAGGVSGGVDNPVLNDKVPAHTHGFSGSSTTESTDHSHPFYAVSGYMLESNPHNHGVSDPGHAHGLNMGQRGTSDYAQSYPYASPGISGLNSAGSGTGISVNHSDINHRHEVSGQTGGISTLHTHGVSGTTDNNASPASWAPRYIDMILCVRN